MGVSSAALLIVGVLLVALGLFAAGIMIVVGLGVFAMIAAGVLEVLESRRS